MEQQIRKQLEMRNEYQMHAIQAFYDTNSELFWFLVFDTILIHAKGEIAEYLIDQDESGILEYFRESILPKF